MGPKGRKALVDSWSQYLPMYSTQEPIAPQIQNQTPPTSGSPVPMNETQGDDEDEEEELAEGLRIFINPLFLFLIESSTTLIISEQFQK